VAVLTAAGDADLGHALRAGDTDAVEELFVRYRARLHDAVRQLVDNQAVAEDLTQEAFLRALEQRATLREPAHVRAWLYRIAINLAKEHVLRERDARHLEVRESLPAGDAGPEQAAMEHGDEQLVWSALLSLEPRQRTALDLAVRHNLSVAEVAQALGISVAHAHVVVHRAKTALGHAIRALLIARSRTHCDRLAAMVPSRVQRLTPWQRRSVEHHMRHCATCQARADVLTSPLELLGGIALLPLPASHANGWRPRHGPPTPAPAAARLGVRRILRTPAAVAGGAALLLFGGIGGVVLLHNAPPPTAQVDQPHRVVATLSPTAEAVPTADVSTPPPTPTPTPEPTPTPTPDAAQAWASAQQLVRGTRGYHVTYSSFYVYPDGGPVGNPQSFDLEVQPNGNYSGSYTAIDGYIGKFDIQRVGGVISVRHINTAGNMGIPGAPEDALQFFDISQQQADSLGDSWFPLTGSGQQPAAARLTTALAPYVSAAALASQVLAPPAGPLTMTGGLDPGSTEVQGGGKSLTFRPSPDPFVALSTSTFDLRLDQLR
jgi:RNA polymerase sigma factor (sigma-70 family)